MDWFKVSEVPPPPRTVLETKNEDDKGTRDLADLKRLGNLWWLPDGSMCVYYTPTHWRHKP